MSLNLLDYSDGGGPPFGDQEAEGVRRTMQRRWLAM